VIYVEYIEHDRFLPIQIFHKLGLQDGWSGGEDVKVANLGRAERLAPGPSVMCFWRNSGLARMDEWEAAFRTPESQRDPGFQATRLGIHFVEAGLYDEIVGGPPLGKGLHYVEFFAPGEEIADGAMREHFEQRAKKHKGGKLGFVLRRLGVLGPDPGGLAVWTFPSYAGSEGILREKHASHPLRPLRGGLYWNFEESLI
jgi:hypothetical protein